MVVWANYKAYVDWNGDGDFSDSNEDISAYVLEWNWEYGRSGPSTLNDRSEAALIRLVLDNSSDLFSKNNSGGAIYGSILAGRLVRITMTIGAGSEITMLQGDLDEIETLPADRKAEQRAILSAHGVLGRLSEAEEALNIAMQSAIASGAAVTAVLDAAGFPAGDRSIDAGYSTFGRWWGYGQPIEELRKIEDTELGFIRETKDGKLAWEDRGHRPDHHASAAATYTNDPTGSIRYSKIWPRQNNRADVVNLARAEVRVFNITDEIVLWLHCDVKNGQGGKPLVIPAAVGGVPGTLEVWAQYPTKQSDRSYIGVNEWTLIHFLANTAADGEGTNITSDVSCVQTKYGQRQKLAFSNANASEAHLVWLRADGTAVIEGDPVVVKSEDLTSQAAYKIRANRFPGPFLEDQTEAQGFCDHQVALFKDEHDAAIVTIEANASAGNLAEAQARDVSDRIHLHADLHTGLYYDQDFYVERIAHRIVENGIHTMTVHLSAAVTHDWPATDSSRTAITVPPGVPDDLAVASIDPAMHCTFGATAWKHNDNITGARFRAKWFADEQADPVDLRTVAEGGTLVHDGVTEYADDDVYANHLGAQYEFDSVSPDSPSTPLEGYWYFAFQFKSPAGDSVWSDGNRTPKYVTDCLPTDATAAEGPPADWWVETVPDEPGHRVKVRAGRPKTNGGKIWSWRVQIKDNRTGQWTAVSYDWPGSGYYPVDASNIRYGDLLDSNDGDIPHTVSLDNRRFTRSSGTGLTGYHYPDGGDYVRIGDLILVDVRGGQWSEEYCQWGTIESIQGVKTGYNVATATYFDVRGRFRGIAQSDVRLLVVDPPWDWTGEGFFGAAGMWAEDFWSDGKHGDKTTEIFESSWIDVPADVPLSAIEARVWFDNGYSVSDNNVTVSSGLTGDTGNPSGASGLDIITHEEDASIPAGQVVLQFNRETANYKGIYAVAAVLSSALPAEGPYDAERTEHTDCVIEEGTCTVVKGDKAVSVSRPSPPSDDVVGRVLLIYTDDASPDSDLDGNVIAAATVDTITLTSAFNKSGAFSYAIVKRWWDRSGAIDSPPASETENLAYAQFTPAQCAGDPEQTVWRTPAIAAPDGEFYATLYCRNKFGVGTRLTAGTAETPPVLTDSDCVTLSVDSTPSGGSVDIDCSLGRSFHLATGGDDVTINNPTNGKCGRAYLILITGAGAITLGDKFNARGATLTRSSGRDYLGFIYNETDDEFDCWWSQDA